MVKFRRRIWRSRSACRSATRSHVRNLTRSCLRALPGFRRGPGDLSRAVAAYARAVRAHRRLVRLSPRFFDAAVVNRKRREQEERRRYLDGWEPAIARAYGRDSGSQPPPPNPTEDRPPLPPSRTCRAIDRELAACRFWLATGGFFRERYCRRRPHALISLTLLARLLEVAFDLKRLAAGMDSGSPPPAPSNPYGSDSEWALRRAYAVPSTSRLKEPVATKAGQTGDIYISSGVCEPVLPN